MGVDIISACLRFAAAVWLGWLAWRLREKKLYPAALLLAFLGSLVVYKIVHGGVAAQLPFDSKPNLVVSIVFLAILGLLHFILIERESVRRRLMEQREALEQTVTERTREYSETNSRLEREIAERRRVEAQVAEINSELEQRVEQRARELTSAVAALRREVAVRKSAQRKLEDQNEILSQIAQGGKLGSVLETLVRQIESRHPRMLVSILLLDREGRHLHHGAAPSLPAEYVEALNGVAIGPSAGCWGTAAWRRERVIVSAIADDPLCEAYAGLAAEHGLAACWAEPILSREGECLGAFAMYFRQPRGPSPEEMEAIEQVVALAGVAIQQQRSREELADSHTRFELATGAGRVGIWDFDINTQELYTDATLKAISGYDPDERFDNPRFWSMRLYPPDVEKIHRARAEHILQRTPYFEVEHRIIGRDGKIRWHLMRGRVISGPDGEPVRITGASTDITAQKEAEAQRRSLEEQVQKAQKLESLGMLAAGIAHDFNNLLTGILGHAELALEDVPDSSPARAPLEKTVEAAAQAGELTRQLLAFAGQGSSRKESIQLNPLVEASIRVTAPLVPPHISIEFDAAADLPPVEGDPSQLRQIVFNLVLNAVEAMEQRRGRIRLRTALWHPSGDVLAHSPVEPAPSTAGYVTLTVEDQGPGLSMHTRSRIFEPLFTTKPTGKGIGLTAVLGIVRRHRGAILTGDAEGGGARFRVLFPPQAAIAEASPESGARPCPPVQRRGSLLVVDDEETVLNLSKTVLERAGFEVVPAAAGAEALDIFRRQAGAIDGVILDWTLPGTRGGELLRALARIQPGARVLLTSGARINLNSENFGDSLKLLFLQKPYRPGQLVEKVQQLLEA